MRTYCLLLNAISQNLISMRNYSYSIFMYIIQKGATNSRLGSKFKCFLFCTRSLTININKFLLFSMNFCHGSSYGIISFQISLALALVFCLSPFSLLKMLVFRKKIVHACCLNGTRNF